MGSSPDSQVTEQRTHVAHKASCYHVHLAATISQSLHLPPLNHEAHQCLWTNPVHGGPVVEEEGSMLCGGHMAITFMVAD